MPAPLNIQDVLKAFAKSFEKDAGLPPYLQELQKAWVQPGNSTTGLAAYDLEAPAKLLYPVLTPLRNDIPRVGGGMGTATNWRAITGINTSQISAGVSEGRRGAVIQHTTADYTAAYRGIGLEDNVTFEAEYAGQGFDDVRSRAQLGTLQSLMIQEEQIILGGNTSMGLGTTPTPTLAASTSGGTLATATYSVICVALTLDGTQTASIGPNGVRGQVSRLNADGTTDTFGGGSAQQSAAATIGVTGPTGSLTATVTPVKGAYAYAWYVGVAGSERINQVTYINSVKVTAASGGGNQLASAITNPAADNSTNALIFDGLMTFTEKTGNNAFVLTQATGTAGTGTPLTASTDGSIPEFDQVLQYMWDTFRLSPDEILVSSQEQKNIQAKILAAGTNAAQRFVFNVEQGKIMGGTIAISYLNRFGMSAGGEYGNGKEIPIRIHPNMPAGTILFRTKQLPYKLSNITDIVRVKTRREYYSTEWPLRTRMYEYGVYADELLQHYAPFSYAMIKNVGNG